MKHTIAPTFLSSTFALLACAGLVACDDPELVDELALTSAPQPAAGTSPASVNTAVGDDPQPAVVSACSDAVYVGNYNVTSKADIAALNDYAKIEGSLTFTYPPIDYAATGSCLKEVTGNLEILGEGGEITVETIEGLETVGGSLTIDTAIFSANAAFPSLESVGGDVEIALFSSETSDLPSFESLATIGGELWIYESDIQSLSGFNALETVGGGVIHLEGMDVELLSGFNALETFDGDLAINALYSLTDISGFTALETVTGGLSLSSIGIVDLVGFPSLTTIGGSIDIADEPYLESIDIGGQLSIGGNLLIAGNPELPQCDAEAFVAQLVQVGGTVTVSGNKPC
ncbi:hypothetical protein G6O69_03865 [Pseudenhygromyxa sp. WMMC2535]|uniref:hypothetical protein n=1 Tax=Pseudenhygromyxa sp. WMMC2535 TaxID=2712867 RepID=UPI0015544E80|nr:hypothetical protein [Pseudenhygromyxa sp. WMMC2535]NVB36952.1 hypothetical protein [Pseudenhygromyxa sp. WMMC2535]